MVGKIIFSALALLQAIYFSIFCISKIIYASATKQSLNIIASAFIASITWALFYIIISLPAP